MSRRMDIKDERGFTFAFVDYHDNGDANVFGIFGDGLVGYYIKSMNLTFLQNGRIYCQGDGAAALAREKCKKSASGK